MKGKFTPFFILITVFIILFSACVRPASGGPVSVPTTTGISNPVATQSALMKEIIAGTQTAMAQASSAGTPLPTVSGATPAAGDTTATGLGTNTPVYPSPTANKTVAMLPTQTQGPPPEVQPTYVSGYYDSQRYDGGVRIEVINVVQGQTITIQTDNTPPDTMFTVKMDVYGNSGIEGGQNIYALNGIIVGFTNSGKGGVFQATYTIPDALRNTPKIHILIISMPYWGVAYTDNVDWTKP